jgi:hypothetical protein
MDRIGDRAGAQVVVQCQRLPHQRAVVSLRVGALRDADAAEVFACGAGAVHVVPGDQRETGVWTAGAVGIHRVLGEVRERRQRLAETVHVIRIGTYTGNEIRIAGLHGARRPSQRHAAAGTAHRHVIQPAW